MLIFSVISFSSRFLLQELLVVINIHMVRIDSRHLYSEKHGFRLDTNGFAICEIIQYDSGHPLTGSSASDVFATTKIIYFISTAY